MKGECRVGTRKLREIGRFVGEYPLEGFGWNRHYRRSWVEMLGHFLQPLIAHNESKALRGSGEVFIIGMPSCGDESL